MRKEEKDMFRHRSASTALALGFGLFAPWESLSQETRHPLQLTVVQVRDTSAQPALEVELHNSGDHDLILNLGMMLGNGQRQFADRIRLLLTDPHGRLLHLDMTGPPIIAQIKIYASDGNGTFQK
jgi:hypothetical protein